MNAGLEPEIVGTVDDFADVAVAGSHTHSSDTFDHYHNRKLYLKFEALHRERMFWGPALAAPGIFRSQEFIRTKRREVKNGEGSSD